MSLLGKNLAVGAQGPDVVILQGALRELGLDIPDDETAAGRFGKGTGVALARFQRSQRLDPTGIADDHTVEALTKAVGHELGTDDRPAPDPDARLVRGQVMYYRGLPIAGLPIRVVHRGLRTDLPLGATTTDDRGEYVVRYSVAELPQRRADIQIRAYADDAAADGAKADTAIAQSRVIYAAGSMEKMRLRVYGGPDTRWTEYQQLAAELATHLEDLPVGDLAEKAGRHDVSLLAGKTHQPIRRLADFVVAHKMAAHTELPAEALYGFVRGNAGTDLVTLLGQSDDQLQRTLRRAADAGIVPGAVIDGIDGVAPRLREAAVGLLARDPQALGGALTALPDRRDRTEFLNRWMAAATPAAPQPDPAGGADRPVGSPDLATATQAFWRELADHPRLGPAVPVLQLDMQLAALTGSHAPLVRQLSARLADGQGALRALAGFSAADFEAAIRQLPEDEQLPAGFTVPFDGAGDPGLPEHERAIGAYARTLTTIIADAMPTAAFAHRAAADERQSDDLRRFFRNVATADTEIDLLDGTFDRTKLDPLLDGVQDKARVRAEVGGVSRLLRVTTDYDHLDALRRAGLDSARAIDQLGAGVLIARHADELGGPAQTLQYAEKAAMISATSTALFEAYAPLFNNLSLPVLPAWDTTAEPTLENLFGSLDLCACSDCRTVFSPAAYLAELLGWLGQRAAGGGRTARDVLYARRPDIGEIELSCINTNNALPYIDLVNELLETVVAPVPPVALDAAFAAELDASRVSDELRAQFAGTGLPLTADHAAFVVAADSHWFLTDRAALWVVRRTSPAELTATFGSYQTSASTTELAADAEHRWPAAYTLLRNARYPADLPLDLWTLEVRTYLGHLLEPGVAAPNRAELMRTLAPAGVDPDASPDIATESLGLTVSERALIVDPVPADPWALFGLLEHGNPIEVFAAGQPGQRTTIALDWIDALRWVRPLLDRTGLTYDELLTLLGTDYVNPGRAIRIESADPDDPLSCAVFKLVLAGPDPAADLDDYAAAAIRLLRFTRLRRVLGWPARHLDDLITALAGATADVDARLDGPLVTSLAGADRLHRQLGIGLDELPGFWATLATTRPDDQFHRLFGDPTVRRPVDPAFAVDPTAAGGPELAIVAADPAHATVAAHAPTVLAALQLTDADLTTLLAVLPDGRLTLANLSRLYRCARLARALNLEAGELIALLEVADSPFAAGLRGPAATLRFAALVTDVRSTGLSIADVDYLLYHRSAPAAGAASVAIDDGQIALVLDDLRGDLRLVADATTVADDPDGTLLGKALAGLRWPAGLIASVTQALDGTAGYSAPLAALPAGLVLPPDLVGRIGHADGRLTVRGALTTAERDALLAADPDPAFGAAVTALYQAPRDDLTTALKVFEWPALRVPLAALPPNLVLPAGLRARVYYDAPAGQLVGKAPVTAAEAVPLAAASTDPTWRAAVAALVAAPAGYAPLAEQRFLTAAQASALADLPGEPARRFAALLAPVLHYVRRATGRRLIGQKLSQDFGIAATVADRLLAVQLPAAGDPALPAITDLLADPFVTSDRDVPVTRAAFAAQFDTYTRMYKVAQVVAGLRLTTGELDWLARFGPTVAPRPVQWRAGAAASWWDPRTVVVAPTARTAAPLAALLRLAALDRLRDTLTETATGDLLAAAREPGVVAADLFSRFAEAVSATGRPVTDADVIALAAAVQVAAPADFVDEAGPARLLAAVRLVRRTGASVTQLLGLAAPEASQDDARTARQLVRARYDDAGWQGVAKPLRDGLRARQRTALVRYALSHPELFAPHPMRDDADLFGYLLMDSQMEPIMLSSRIKQAISSIQQFVQRCSMQLEPDVTVDAAVDPGWNDWTWMSGYVLWAGNRQILCYPENWLEPSLRDDKTPFFAELESALMQDDVTAELVEDAFTAYLQRLNDIARLEILGIWDQPPVAGRPATLHLIGRSRGKAPKYYHRTRIAGAAWTAWRPIDLDIAEPQVLPVVWNRRLYLFWPVFTDVTPSPAAGDKPVVPTNRRVDLTLAYSRFSRGKWQPKQLTDLTVSTPLAPLDDAADGGRGRFVLRASVPGSGGPDLWIWPEWDDPHTTMATATSPYQPGTPGTLNYANVTGFHFTGADDQVEPFHQNISGIFEPSGTTPVGMLFAQKGSAPLKLPAELHGTAEDTAFAVSPPTFSLAYPHQDQYLSGQRTFVYQDTSKTYVVDPIVGSAGHFQWVQPEKVHPGIFGAIKDRYYTGISAAAAAAALIRNPAVIDPPAGPRPDPVARLGTADPVRLAMAQVDAKAAFLTDAAAAQRDLSLLPARTDKRYVVSKADKAMVPISAYLDDARIVGQAGWQWVSTPARRYVFRAGFHPYACDFEQDLAVGGVERLLARANQLRTAAPFAGRYGPGTLVSAPYPVEDVDFTADGFFQQYNWELFFHAPLLIATKLAANQRFAEAQRWFHLIFNPRDTSNGPTPARFWQTRPFYELTQPQVLAQRITELITALAGGTADPGTLQQIAAWRSNPFNPYAVARLRPVAFQKMVVMRYWDNQLAWADHEFRQDTSESILRALGLFVQVGEGLGRRPTTMAPRALPQVRTAVSLDADVDTFSDTLVQIEQVIGAPAPDAVRPAPDAPPLTWPKTLYFGVPSNTRLAGYWDTLADRLFKIRNSMNIEGVVRQLPLFDQLVDPALLVRAAAAGMDLSSALADSSAPTPHYRFRTLVAQALTLAADVRSLGAALLSALEKRDAEALAQLRATHERLLADDVEKIRVGQESEADQRIAALRVQRAGSVQRYLHFQKLLGVTAPAAPAEDKPIPLVAPSANASITTSDGVKLLGHEKSELDRLEDSSKDQQWAAGAQGVGSLLAIIPTIAFDVTPWGIGVGSSWGGANLAAAANALASVFTANAASANFQANKSARLAQAVIREHDWVLQSNQAAQDIMLIDSQRAAAQLAKKVATDELASARRARDQAAAVQEYLQTKYTGTELYDWLLTQTSALYFQAYQLAYDMAKKAERAMRRELGTTDGDLIQFGYWDSLRRGLLAGERLQLAVHRLNNAYLDANRRTYEITKHLSLAAVNPAALVDLRQTGRCTVQLPEPLFDLDRPGDYQRRIKMVSLTIPGVLGPYVGVSCQLTLLSSVVRTKATPATPYRSTGADDARFQYSVGAGTSIVTSSGRDDSGLFAPSFNDERFLPFEGEGAVSTWQLDMPAEFAQFDRQTIPDVVLTVCYTALYGGDPLRAAAVADLKAALKAMEVQQGRRGLYRLLSVRQDDRLAWQAMRSPAPGALDPHTLTITIGPDRFPFLYQNRTLTVDRVAVFFRTAAYDAADPFAITLQPPGGAALPLPVAVVGTDLGSLPAAVTDIAPAAPVGPDATWTVQLTALPSALVDQVDVDGTPIDRLKPDALEDIGVLLHYTF